MLIREKKLGNTNLRASRRIKREKATYLCDAREPEVSLFLILNAVTVPKHLLKIAAQECVAPKTPLLKLFIESCVV